MHSKKAKQRKDEVIFNFYIKQEVESRQYTLLDSAENGICVEIITQSLFIDTSILIELLSWEQ